MAAGAKIRADTKQFQALGKGLKAAGDGAIKKKLYKGVSRATKPARAEIRQSAISILPRGGGLNQWAATLTVTTRQFYQGNGAGVLIKGGKNAKTKTVRSSFIGPLKPGQKRTRKTRRKGTFGKAADMNALNRGRVWHPFWGRMPHPPERGVQVLKRSATGFFDKPLDGKVGKRMRKEVLAVLDEITAEVNAKIRQG